MLIYLATGFGAYFLLAFHQEMFFSSAHEFTVVKMDAPEYCSSQSGMFSTRERSSAPERSEYGYCGAIYTTAGDYDVVEDWRWLLLDPGRSEILGELREGCRYRVTISGYPDKVEEGGATYSHLVHRIRRVDELLGCDDAAD